ncbi:MAG TPA: flippase [Candidatus Bathyarchaeia archaeon]|nr:flippase [Candidatus Bathyarchaeia archaeon]
MTTHRRIFKNTAALASADIFTRLMRFALAIVIARTLGAAGYGIYAFAFSFAEVYGVVSDFGMSNLIIRDTSRDKKYLSRYLGNILLVETVLSLIAFGFLFVLVGAMNLPPEKAIIVYIAVISYILTNLAQILRATFKAHEKMEYDALLNVAQQSITVILGVLALYFGYGLIALALAFVIGSLVNLVASLVLVSTKFTKPKFALSRRFLNYLGKEVPSFGLIVFFTLIYYDISTVLLSFISGDAATGWFNAAYAMSLALTFLPAAFMGALFPVISTLHVSSRDLTKTAYNESFRYMVILGLPLAFGTTVLADKIIDIIYGAQFHNSAVVLQIVIWSITILFLNFVLTTTLTSINLQRVVMYATGLSVAVNIVLNLLFIPPFSYVGASAVMVATELTTFSICFYFASKNLCLIGLPRLLVKPLVGSFIMAVVVYYLRPINLFIIIGVAVWVYFATLIALRTFTTQDVSVIKSIVGRT